MISTGRIPAKAGKELFGCPESISSTYTRFNHGNGVEDKVSQVCSQLLLLQQLPKGQVWAGCLIFLKMCLHHVSNVLITFYLKTPGEELHEDSLFNHGDVLGVEYVSPRAGNLLQTPIQQGKHPGHSLELCIPEQQTKG